MGKTAVIIGATGLTGKKLLSYLLNDEQYDCVKVLARKELLLHHPKLEQYCTHFDQMEQFTEQLSGHDYYCCLGTTLKKAGSKKQQQIIDRDYPIMFANIASKHKARFFVIISSVGADAKSSNFYLKTKGEMEDGIENSLGSTSVKIFRPGLLLGNRSELRVFEKMGMYIMKIINPFLLGILSKYKAIHIENVAKAMLLATKLNTNNTIFYYSDIMQLVANKK